MNYIAVVGRNITQFDNHVRYDMMDAIIIAENEKPILDAYLKDLSAPSSTVFAQYYETNNGTMSMSLVFDRLYKYKQR